ncbi:2-haloacid dehalogenase [Microdochium nivale]|nr:2-haloacid dehalogenase [Microdochium nivale]
MINNPPRDSNPGPSSTYNPEIVQTALRTAIQQFQQQTLALSTSAAASVFSSDPSSPTGSSLALGYQHHSRHGSLVVAHNSALRRRTKVVVAFDLYGTLLSTDSIVHELAKHYGDEAAPGIATLWRRFQLEYTWRITSMGEFKNFAEITRSALGHALMEHSGIKLTAKAATELMRAYESLHVFPDVEAGLALLKQAKAGKAVLPPPTAASLDGVTEDAEAAEKTQQIEDNGATSRSTSPASMFSATSSASSAEPEIECYIFTNGTPDMVIRSIVTSPELSPHTKASNQGLFSDPQSIVTADATQCFKPDPRTYKRLMEVAGVRTEHDRSNVWVVSANPFDVVGAKAAGLRAAWIDRGGKGWIDRLDEMRVPSVTATGIEEAVKAILSWVH